MKGRIYTVDDPFFGEDIPKPEGNPYEALLKPLLERDSKQCDAWKDEVQNILIFAGLFSAVITAFIIESYQKLQADPNDQIVMLLTRISDQLGASPNNTTAPLFPIADAPFIPSPSDIRVNIFWFIGLVLSLTVALIGIITLQWLREHQRYDSSIEPMEAFGIFNARSEALRRWYVPQIFAVLPLLLQGALVLFFVGLIDFLFAIQINVAIPVAVSLGIPVFFLVATTLLPTLQVYAMEFPHLLSVNYNVPAPCPYKSPQSLISRRLALLSQTFFRFCTHIFATVYAPFVLIRRMLTDAQKPFYGELAPFYGSIGGRRKSAVTAPRINGDWMSIDRNWLSIRTRYATVVHTPDDFHGTHSDLDDSLLWWCSFPTNNFYDCTQGILRNPLSNNENSSNDLYHCGEALIGELCSGWDQNFHGAEHLEDGTTLMRGRCMTVMTILDPYDYLRLPTRHIQARPGDTLPDMKVLRNAYRGVLMGQTQPYEVESARYRRLSQRLMESHMRFITTYLLENTQQFFECTSNYVLPRSWPNYDIYHIRRKIVLHCPDWMNDMSQQWTLILTNMIQNSLKIRPPTLGASHVCSSYPPCNTNVENDNSNAKDLMQYILMFQVRDDINHTLQLLNHYCTSTSHPVHDLPYVLIIACAYLDAVATVGCSEGAMGFQSLLETVSSICGNQTQDMDRGAFNADEWHWFGLEPALTYIRENRTEGLRNTPKREQLELPDLLVDHNEVKAPNNV